MPCRLRLVDGYISLNYPSVLLGIHRSVLEKTLELYTGKYWNVGMSWDGSPNQRWRVVY